MTGANGDTGPGSGPGRRWDVALSFAGAQRNYVEQVAQALQAGRVRCFYDADEQIDLWGKYLAEELPVIYGEQAAAVVVFISAEYAARDWTRLERRAALARAVRERREYVLPARFDETTLPGLLSDMHAVDLRTRTPQQFAAMIVGKLAALGITAPTPPANASDLAAQIRDEGSSAGVAARTAAGPIRADRSQAIRLLGEAERIARLTTNESGKALALAEVAKVLAAVDLDGAARLTEEAQRVARSIADGVVWRGPEITEFAMALAASDPDRAERLAWSITDMDRQVCALTGVAMALAASDPDRAAGLIAYAERAARSITADPPTDEDVVWTVSLLKAQALWQVAKALAASDPDRAEHVARSITNEIYQAWALAEVAKALAASDPDRAAGLIAHAEHIARSITDGELQEQALTAVATALAASDPERAARLARSFTDEELQAWALGDVAKVMAASDPDRAVRLVRYWVAAEPRTGWVTTEEGKESLRGWALGKVAKVLAASDPERAERLARSITDEKTQAEVLAEAAKAWLQGW